MTDQETLDTPNSETPAETGKQPADKTDRFKKDIERAEKRGAARLLKELGLNSVEELRAKINPQTSPADDGLKSELETMRTQIAKLTETAEQSRKEAENLKTQRRNEATLNTLRTHVKGLRLRETVAEDIIGLATVTGRDLSKLLGDDLQPNAAELKTLEDEMRTLRPEWFKAVGIGSPSAMGKPPTEQDKKRLQDAANAQWAAIKRGG